MQIKRAITNSLDGEAKARKQVPIDKKLRLAQSIRQENMDNRMKIRQRERLLYGTESSLPLWEKGGFLHTEEMYGANINPETGMPIEENGPESSGSFRLRMAAAIFLFIGFLLCDAGQYKVFGYSTGELYGLITEDYFQLYEGDNGNVPVELTELLKIDL